MMEGTEVLSEFQKVLKEVTEDPDKWPDTATFISIDTLLNDNMLTPNKLKIIKYLKENDVESLTNLADKLDRSKHNVSSDIKSLETYGLVETEKDGRKKIPYLGNDHIIVLF